MIIFLFISTMFANKQPQNQKRTASNKKVHRRVVTEMNEMPPAFQLHREQKKGEKINSKPKFLDVYSKYMPKISGEVKKNAKMAQNKPLASEKHLKTEANEHPKLSLPHPQSQRLKITGSKYEIDGVAGKGTFGVVYFGVNKLTGDKIAIKKVFQDRKYKNREHTILKMLNHPNNLLMKDSYLTTEGEDEYLNIVMEYYSDNLYQLIKKKEVSPLLTKLYAYQLIRGLNYLSMLSIAHRDIKPQNILIDKYKHIVVISDFGSAKQLVKKETNLAYICSRCYRAPELIFGATDYTPQIDMWSAGCVLVEMINGVPPFMGDSQIDQLIEIIKVLGTPSKEEVQEMNKNYDMREYNKFPKVKTHPWKSLLKTKDPLLVDLVTKILAYSPIRRLTPAEALYHEYFDDLRDEARYQEMLFKVKNVPDLFDFSTEEVSFISEVTKKKFGLVPGWSTRKHTPSTLTHVSKPAGSVFYHRKPILSTKAL